MKKSKFLESFNKNQRPFVKTVIRHVGWKAFQWEAAFIAAPSARERFACFASADECSLFWDGYKFEILAFLTPYEDVLNTEDLDFPTEALADDLFLDKPTNTRAISQHYIERMCYWMTVYYWPNG